ncbi:alkaline ceramidase-like [Oppia nitens]|uniref:alkaline ceramidase-like n=1 Tax=Oppia nitens TaxID=1686743 RepID=UPI0023DA2CDE|nr:alkaline ceramidase-like [Oppia nitens]
MSLMSALDRGTASIDWCESNYRYSPIIAEFINTVTNILFLVFPALLSQLFKQYAQTVNRGVYVIWFLFATVGICSAYFHATLSLVGQLLDELAILWLMAAAFGMWLPRRHYPLWLNRDRKQFQYLMFSLSLFGSMISCLYPWFNCIALMCLGIPAFVFLGMELKECRNSRVKRLGLRCFLCWIFAMFSWIFDRLFCDVWSAVNFPYLHGLWHILIAITSYTICVLFAYFDAIKEHEEKQPVLMFWPRNEFQLGVPYVVLKNAN